jgi:hypothetical protein
MFIVITDPNGAAYYDGTPVPITHRIEVIKGQVFGLENFIRKFSSQAELQNFLEAAVRNPVGSDRRFSWAHDSA